MQEERQDEITPAMIAAGREAVLAGVNWSSEAPLWVGPYDAGEIAIRVFRAMAEARSGQ